MSGPEYKPLPAPFGRNAWERRLKGGAHSYMILSDQLALAFRSGPHNSDDALGFLKEQYRQIGVVIDALQDAAERGA